jgi:hypothetical protein
MRPKFKQSEDYQYWANGLCRLKRYVQRDAGLAAWAFAIPQRFQMCAVVLTEVMLASLKNTMQL